MKRRRLGTIVSHWWWLWLPALGVGVRLAYVLLVGKSELSWGDEVTYDLLARNLIAGHGYSFVPGEPSLWRAPLYPFLLAGCYGLFGVNYTAVLVVQAVVGGLSALLLTLVGRRLFDDELAPLLAGCMFAVHPLLIFASGLLYSETVYLFLLLLLTLSGLKLAEESETERWAVITGGLLGISVLMKPNLLLLPLALILWLWLVLRDGRRALVLGGVVALTMAVVVLPWTVRNYRVSGAFVPVSANAGLNLWQGNHPQADGAAYPLSQVDPLETYSEVERDGIYREWAVEQIRSDPGRFLALIPRKIVKFFSPLETSNRGRIPLNFGFLVDWGWGVFLALAGWGLLRTTRRFGEWMLVYLLFLYPVGLTAVFYGGTRYGMVVYPYLFLFAASPLAWAVDRLKLLLEKKGETEVEEHGA